MRVRRIRSASTVLIVAILLAARVASADPGGGIAVAPLRALDVPEGTASILTGLAEAMAQQHVTEGRLVAHGELLRAVDAGADRGCRDEPCLTRAAAALGSAHLLTGEVGTLGDAHVLSVRITATEDGETRTAVSRECRECDESALPAMLEEALLEALAALVPAQPAEGDEGRTITMLRQRGEGDFRYEETTRTVQRALLEVQGVQLSSLTRAGAELGCVTPGEVVSFETTLEAHNPDPRPRTLRGTLSLELLGPDDEKPLARADDEVVLTLDGLAPDGGADPGGEVDDRGVWIPPAHVAKHSLAVTWTATPAAGLRIRVSWDGEILEELETRPVTTATRLEEFFLTREGQRVGTLTWGEEMEAHLALTRVPGAPAAEVTLRMERMIRFWFDTENIQAMHLLPEDS